MAITTIYKCDKCGAEQPTNVQFWHLDVGYQELSHSYGKSYTKGIHVCRKCLESLGINASKAVRESPEYNPPTIEDLIAEIVQRELDAR